MMLFFAAGMLLVLCIVFGFIALLELSMEREDRELAELSYRSGIIRLDERFYRGDKPVSYL